MEEIRVLSPTAILGYGFPVASFEAGLAREPHVIAVDAGSTDPGPYYLGSGISFTDRTAVKRDLRLMLIAACAMKIPLLIGSAGGAGAEPHLDWNLDILMEIAREEQLHFSLAVIHAELDKKYLAEKLQQNQIAPLEPGGPLTLAELEASTHVVAQMGIEPMLAALQKGAQVILAGRSYDPTMFAALPLMKGFDPGLALHMGKILECASIATVPGSGSDAIMGYLRQDHFVLEPLNPERRCTVTSVAAHTLYEKTNPYFLPGPGGTIDLTGTSFEQVEENQVKVTGSRFKKAEKYTVKLEGASLVGFRTVSLAGVRDPVFIQQADEITQGVRAKVRDNFAEIDPESYYLDFHLYGRNGVMGDLEPERDTIPKELGLIIEAVADTQELANTLCSFARSTMLHYGYPGRISTAGNLAFPYSPSDFKAGEVYRFSIYHLLEVEDPLALFPVEIIKV